MCRYYSAKVFLFKCKFVGIGAFPNRNGIAFVHFSCKNLLANAIFNVVLNGTFQRSCSKLNIVSLFSNQFFGFVCNGYVVAKLLYSFKQTTQFYVYNLLYGSEIELIEGDNFV